MTAIHVPTSHHTAARPRSWRRDLRTVPGALRSERIKLATVRVNRVLLALTIVIDAVAAFATARLVTDEVLTVAQVFVYPAIFTAVFAAVAGILSFTSEVQHGSLTVTLTSQPARRVIVAAKALMAIAVGVTLGVAGMLAAAGGAALAGLALGSTSALAATAGWALLYTGSAAVIGLGIGLITRHSAGAISGLLVWWFVAENLLHTVLTPSIGRFLPLGAGYRVLGVGSDFDTPETLAVALVRSQNALVIVTFALATLAGGALLLRRRDAS